ncbi:MAG: GNAT family N-acetyltransferase, partial [Chloroflexi bacterium]
LVLPASDLREAARQQIAQTTLELLKKQSDSFAIFDFLSAPQAAGWPQPFIAATISDPGTVMPLNWPTFEAWLDSGNKKDRQHYKRTLREAEKLGLGLARHPGPHRLDEALPLIRAVEKRHDSPPNPWARAMLENMAMVNGIYLTVTLGERLVGCGLLLEDNGAQMTTALGLATDVPYVYFLLIYESLKIAFERQIRLLRWGSGAYDIKKRLGFQMEDNNTILYATSNPIMQKIGQWLGRFA